MFHDRNEEGQLYYILGRGVISPDMAFCHIPPPPDMAVLSYPPPLDMAVPNDLILDSFWKPFPSQIVNLRMKTAFKNDCKKGFPPRCKQGAMSVCPRAP